MNRKKYKFEVTVVVWTYGRVLNTIQESCLRNVNKERKRGHSFSFKCKYWRVGQTQLINYQNTMPSHGECIC